MITLKLLENIWQSKPDIDAQYVFDQLQKFEDIGKAIKHLNKDAEVEREKFELKIKDIKKKISVLQEKCSHWSKTYHPDPSGNNDSYYECDICGTCI